MRLIGANDSHVRGLKPVARTEDQTGWEAAVQGKLDYLFQYARDNHACIMHAGDLFDTPRDWLALQMVSQAYSNNPASIYGITGQHDIYMRNAEAVTSWRIMESFGKIHRPHNPTILCDETSGVELHIYGAGWGEEVPVPDPNLSMNCGAVHTALIIHAPISTRPLYPDHDFTHAKQFLAKWANDYSLIFCGDCHVPFMERVKNGMGNYSYILNSGPMLRLDATEDSFNHKPGFWIVELDGLHGGGVDWVALPHEVDVLSREHLDRKERAEANMDAFVAAISKEDKLTAINIKSEVTRVARESGISEGALRVLDKVMEETDD